MKVRRRLRRRGRRSCLQWKLRRLRRASAFRLQNQGKPRVYSAAAALILVLALLQQKVSRTSASASAVSVSAVVGSLSLSLFLPSVAARLSTRGRCRERRRPAARRGPGRALVVVGSVAINWRQEGDNNSGRHRLGFC